MLSLVALWRMTKGLILVIHSTGPHAKVKKSPQDDTPTKSTPIGEFTRQGTRFRADVLRGPAARSIIINVNSAMSWTGSLRVSKSSSLFLLTPPYPYIDRHGSATTGAM
jgi:hypothetical protein